MSTVQQLEQRLRTGEQMINAEHDLNRRVELEDYWLRLLADYEAAYDAERQQEVQAAM